MKKFRPILVTAALTAGIFCCVFYLSCKKKCGSTVCQNGGTCDYSLCVCPEGYSGNACQTGWTDQFVGTYLCSDSVCHPAIINTGTWQSSITKDATNSGYTIDISNFAGTGLGTVVGTVDSAGNMTIAPSAGGGVDAVGKLVNDTLTMQFTTESASGATFRCTMVMIKQG